MCGAAGLQAHACLQAASKQVPTATAPRTLLCRRFVEELVQTSHSEKVNDLAFPHEFSDVFATCGLGYIRVWHLATCRELLRINVPNLEAHCVSFSTVRPAWGVPDLAALRVARLGRGVPWMRTASASPRCVPPGACLIWLH